MVYYEEVGVTKVEPMTWATGIQHARLLNMLYVPHFRRRNINTICVCQLLTLVHDRALWLGERITINVMLIIQINVTLPPLLLENLKKRSLQTKSRNIFMLSTNREAMMLARFFIRLSPLPRPLWPVKIWGRVGSMRCQPQSFSWLRSTLKGYNLIGSYISAMSFWMIVARPRKMGNCSIMHGCWC